MLLSLDALKAASPILLIELGSMILVMPLPLNAYLPILITPSGITKSDRAVVNSNALSPILVTLLGMVMLVRLVQELNALLPILVTLLGKVSIVRLVQP